MIRTALGPLCLKLYKLLLKLTMAVVELISERAFGRIVCYLRCHSEIEVVVHSTLIVVVLPFFRNYF